MSKEREERYPTEEQLKQWMDGLVPLTSTKEKVTESYNKAIDDAIKVVDEFSKTNTPFNDPYMLFNNLISRLQKLKK
jgi:hypothetical protein